MKAKFILSFVGRAIFIRQTLRCHFFYDNKLKFFSRNSKIKALAEVILLLRYYRTHKASAKVRGHKNRNMDMLHQNVLKLLDLFNVQSNQSDLPFFNFAVLYFCFLVRQIEVQVEQHKATISNLCSHGLFE